MTGTEIIIDGVFSEALSQEVICELSPEQQEEAGHRQVPLIGRGVLACSRNFMSSQNGPFHGLHGRNHPPRNKADRYTVQKPTTWNNKWVMGKVKPLVQAHKKNQE